MKCKSLCGCEVSLPLCLYLQMQTFERTNSLSVLQCNWCWRQHGHKSLQSAARTEFDELRVHYRYVCSFWRPWLCFITLSVWYSYSRFIADHRSPPLDHIVSQCNSPHTFITFSLILHCIACCSQIHSIIIIIIHIFKDLCREPLSFPQSIQYTFIGFPALIFPCRIKFRIF